MISYLLAPLDGLTTTVGEFRAKIHQVHGSESIPTLVVFPCDEHESVEMDNSCPLTLHPVLETLERIAFRLVEVEVEAKKPIFSVAVYGQAKGQPITSSAGERGITVEPLKAADWHKTAMSVTRSLADYLMRHHGYDEDQAAHVTVKMIRERLVFINSFRWERYRSFVIVCGTEETEPTN